MAKKSFGKKFLDNDVVRFVLSAGIGFLIDVAAYYILFHNIFTEPTYRVLGFVVRNTTLAFSISYILGVVVNFIITKYFVFHQSTTSSSKQFFRFVSVAVIGYFANLTLLKVYIQAFHFYPPIARPSAALTLFFASYFIHRMFSFSLSLRHHVGEAEQSNS
ncbi:MAG TPA: GtrA family protein [Mucilaginibacter sp.]